MRTFIVTIEPDKPFGLTFEDRFNRTNVEVIICTVSPKGQAAEMGVRAGDLILKVDDHRVGSKTQLAMLVRSHLVDAPIKLEIGRLEKIGKSDKVSRCVYTMQLTDCKLAPDVVRNLQRHSVKKGLFRQRARLEDLSCVFALAGIIVMQVTVEMTPTRYAKENPEDLSHEEDTVMVNHHPQQDYVNDNFAFWLKALISVLTLMLVVTVHLRYMTHLQLRSSQGKLPPGAQVWHMRGVLFKYILEILVCAFHIPPYVDFAFHIPDDEALNYWYHIDTLGLFMWLRVYLLTSTFRNHSGYYTAGMAHVCASNSVNPRSTMFHFKALFSDVPLKLCVLLSLVLLVVSAFTIQSAERSANEDIDDYWSSLWLSIVSISTVGYGDRSTSTVIGRVVTMLNFVFLGTLLMSFFTTVFVQLVIISEKEEHVMQYHTHEKWRRNMRYWAATVIQRVWKLHQTLRRVELRRMGYTNEDIGFLGKTELCRRNAGVDSGAGNGRGLVANRGKKGWASIPAQKWAMCDAMNMVKTLRTDPPEWLFLNEELDELGELTHDVMQGQTVLQKAWDFNARAMGTQMDTLAAQVEQVEERVQKTAEALRDRGLLNTAAPVTSSGAAAATTGGVNTGSSNRLRCTSKARLAEDDGDDGHDEQRYDGMLDIVSVRGSPGGSPPPSSPTPDMPYGQTLKATFEPVPKRQEKRSQPSPALIQCIDSIENRQLQLASAYKERQQLMHGMQAHMHRMTDCLEILSAHTQIMRSPARTAPRARV
jgi:hypothetical protein